jgi:hypothetical protein
LRWPCPAGPLSVPPRPRAALALTWLTALDYVHPGCHRQAAGRAGEEPRVPPRRRGSTRQGGPWGSCSRIRYLRRDGGVFVSSCSIHRALAALDVMRGVARWKQSTGSATTMDTPQWSICFLNPMDTIRTLGLSRCIFFPWVRVSRPRAVTWGRARKTWGRAAGRVTPTLTSPPCV